MSQRDKSIEEILAVPPKRFVMRHIVAGRNDGISIETEKSGECLQHVSCADDGMRGTVSEITRFCKILIHSRMHL